MMNYAFERTCWKLGAERVAGVRGVRDHVDHQRGEGFIEGDGLAITWCVGHLVELEEPAHYDPKWQRWSLDTLPMLPERFEHKIDRILRLHASSRSRCPTGRR